MQTSVAWETGVLERYYGSAFLKAVRYYVSLVPVLITLLLTWLTLNMSEQMAKFNYALCQNCMHRAIYRILKCQLVKHDLFRFKLVIHVRGLVI